MDDKLSLIIQARLKATAETTLTNEINAIKNKLAQNPILLKLSLDGTAVKNFEAKLAKLEEITKRSAQEVSFGNFDKVSSQVANVGNEIGKASDQADQFTQKIKQASEGTDFSQTANKFEQASIKMEDMISNADKIKTYFDGLGENLKISQVFDEAGIATQKFQVSVENINNKIKETSTFLVSIDEGALSFEKIQMSSKNAAIELDKVREQMVKIHMQSMKTGQPIDLSKLPAHITAMESLQAQRKAEVIIAEQQAIAEDKYRTKQIKRLDEARIKQEKLNNQLEIFKQKMLGGAGIRGQLDIFADKNPSIKGVQQLRTEVEGLTAKTPELEQKMKQISTGFTNLGKEAGQAGTVMGRALENAMKFMRFYIVGGLLVGVVRQVRQAVDSIKEIDAGLTQLRKVTGETIGTMRDFGFVANDIAINLGKSTREVIDAATEFARLGYSIERASKLAEESILFSTVGNMSVEQSTTTLISTIKAFGIEVDEQGKNVRRVIDSINEVGNRYALSQADIGEILQRSSSAMRASGNTLEETIALGVGAQEIVQQANMVGKFAPLYSNV